MKKIDLMQEALVLARKGHGLTSPNPMVGAILVKHGKIIGQGWHQRAGEPHAEIEALLNARAKGYEPKGSTLYVTLEPCSTFGRTPPCTQSIIAAGIKRVVVAATDPNPVHAGKGFVILKRHGTVVVQGILAAESNQLNEVFNHWIINRTPFVTVKSAMTLDGKIATASGESKWITGEKARTEGMRLRKGVDAILVGINTVLADDPSLTMRMGKKTAADFLRRRIILDSDARTPLNAQVVIDEFHALTTIVVSKDASVARIKALGKKVRVLTAPAVKGKINLRWLMKKLGTEKVTSLLVEGGGEVNASFILDGLAHRVAFFYAPKVLGGRNSRKGVSGHSFEQLRDTLKVRDAQWKWLGDDLLLTGRIA